MDIEAKTQISCDSCKKAVALPTKGKSKDAKDKKKEPQPLEAVLEDGLGNTKDYHFCDEECLRVFLNGRRKKSKASYELDIPNWDVYIKVQEM